MSRTVDRMSARAAVGAAVLAIACGDAPAVSPDEKPPLAVRTLVVAPEPVAPALVMPGVVEADARIELSFRVTGYVERFHVDEGERVEAGQVLAVLDEADLEREVRTARAVLERAAARATESKRSYDRQRELHERNSASEQSYDAARSTDEMAQAELREARMRLEMAEDRLAKATLRAPRAGHVERRLVEEFELATAQTPVLVLTVLERVTVRAAVAEVHLPRIRVGAPATVTTSQRPDAPLEGVIERIDLAADPGTRTVPFEVAVENSGLVLRPELVVEVEVPLGEPVERMLVPLAAVLRGSDTQPFCFLEHEGVAERRLVTLGELHEERVAIEAGLSAGDRVIVRGQHFLRPGDRVTVVEDRS